MKDKREGLEEAISTKAEELKKKIVYLKKQLQHQGGHDHHEEFKLGDAIEAMSGEFDHAVAEIRAWFAGNVDTEIAESGARANAVQAAFPEATNRLMEIQAALSAELAQAARDGALAVEQDFVVATQERLDAFHYVAHALTEKVQAWYEEKLAWIGGLTDHYYAEELAHKLTAKRDQALAALADRAAAAQEVVDYRREELAARLGELIAQFDYTANDELQVLADSSAAETANLAGDVQATAEGFRSAASFENKGLNAFLDDLVVQWAWWLKEYYGFAGYAPHHYEGYAEAGAPAAPHAPAGPDPAYDAHAPAPFDPHALAGYDEVEAFFRRDFIGDLPATKDALLGGIDAAAHEIEEYFAGYEETAKAELEARRSELQERLVGQRVTLEDALFAAEGEAKAGIAAARDAFVADVADKRAAVEHAIAQLKEAHYAHGGAADAKDLLYEIHEAKEAFATAVNDARAEFDLVLSSARDASEGRLAAARHQFEADLTHKRAELDAAINGARVALADVAAAKREGLGVALGAAWEGMELAIAEKVDAFNYAVHEKVAWINEVHYPELREKLLLAIKDLQDAFVSEVQALRGMFADLAEERRLAADAAIAAIQDDFEGFVAAVLDTCDHNRGAEAGYLEAAIAERRDAFDVLLGECRKVIGLAIN